MGIRWEKMALGTELAHNICARIVSVQLGIVFVVIRSRVLVSVWPTQLRWLCQLLFIEIWRHLMNALFHHKPLFRCSFYNDILLYEMGWIKRNHFAQNIFVYLAHMIFKSKNFLQHLAYFLDLYMNPYSSHSHPNIAVT